MVPTAAGSDARSLSYAEARELVLGAVRTLPAETVDFVEARGRALRTAIVAPHPLPPFSNTSMDGYAVRAVDTTRASLSSPVELQVVEVLPAGRVASRALHHDEAMRIMTGAPIPDGADAVVPFEESEAIGVGDIERVRIVRPVAAGLNVRGEGDDIAAGEPALGEGRELSAHDLAVLASLGISRVRVGARPGVAILSTGDELLRVEDPLKPGAIRDSNLPLLKLLCEEAGCRVLRDERLRDDPDQVSRAIGEALSMAEVVLTIGGVSAGDFDPIKRVLGDALDAELWRVAMKPGRPQAFGARAGRLFFGLPGNPASVACVFEALVRPALRMMQGYSSLDRPRVDVRAAQAIESREGRTDFVRATLEWRDHAWWASPAGAQISGHVMPQSRAHVLLLVPESVPSLARGDYAEAWVLRWPG